MGSYNPVDSNGNPNDTLAQWQRDTAAALNAAGYTSVASKAITFTGAAHLGATGTINLFTITGQVLVTLIAVVGTTPVGASATIAAGNATTSNRYLPLLTATTMTTGKTEDITGLVTAGTAPNTTPNQFGANGEVIIATVATANITAGQITWYAFYKPLSAGATVVAD